MESSICAATAVVEKDRPWVPRVELLITRFGSPAILQRIKMRLLSSSHHLSTPQASRFIICHIAAQTYTQLLVTYQKFRCSASRICLMDEFPN